MLLLCSCVIARTGCHFFHGPTLERHEGGTLLATGFHRDLLTKEQQISCSNSSSGWDRGLVGTEPFWPVLSQSHLSPSLAPYFSHILLAYAVPIAQTFHPHPSPHHQPFLFIPIGLAIQAPGSPSNQSSTYTLWVSKLSFFPIRFYPKPMDRGGTTEDLGGL